MERVEGIEVVFVVPWRYENYPDGSKAPEGSAVYRSALGEFSVNGVVSSIYRGF